MRPRLNLIGMQFCRLSVLELAGIDKRRNTRWKCLCECGKTGIYSGTNLKNGIALSCGCLRLELASKVTTKHGMTNTVEFRVWSSLKNRCFNVKSQDYPDYGGRGITVCDRWENSFNNFVSDMGLRPLGKYSIDRINTNGNYEPNNCRWGTREQQDRNKRNNVWFEYMGLKMVLQDWAKYFGVYQGNLRNAVKEKGIEQVYQYYLNKHGELPIKKKK